MADKLVCVVAVWRIRIHPVRVVSALIGGFLDRRAVHCQLSETQRYKRYRNLPYPHLAPSKANNNRNPKQASTRVRAKAPSRIVAKAGRATVNGETASRKQKSSLKEESKSKRRNKSESVNENVNTKRTRSLRTTAKVILFCRFFLLPSVPSYIIAKTI